MAYQHTTRSRILAEKRHLVGSEASHAAAITVLDAVEDALAQFELVDPNREPLAARCAEEIAADIINRLGSLVTEYARDIDATQEAIARLERNKVGAA